MEIKSKYPVSVRIERMKYLSPYGQGPTVCFNGKDLKSFSFRYLFQFILSKCINTFENDVFFKKKISLWDIFKDSIKISEEAILEVCIFPQPS